MVIAVVPLEAESTYPEDKVVQEAMKSLVTMSPLAPCEGRASGNSLSREIRYILFKGLHHTSPSSAKITRNTETSRVSIFIDEGTTREHPFFLYSTAIKEGCRGQEQLADLSEYNWFVISAYNNDNKLAWHKDDRRNVSCLILGGVIEHAP